MGTNVRELRRRGYGVDDIALARGQQEAERRAGGPSRSIGEVVAGKPARGRTGADPEDLTARQLRRRGRYGQAALLADQEALTEHDPERAATARCAGTILKGLARKPAQTEFDFFMGNTSVGFAFHDAVLERLKATGATFAERAAAQAVLAECIRWLGWQSYEVTRTAAEISERIGLAESHTASALALLESVGAITRIKRGRRKVITITPEGAYRGRIDNHAETVDRFNAEVVPLRKARCARQNGDPPAAA
jgi:DNA-binding transcriptional ArsR family regulator